MPGQCIAGLIVAHRISDVPARYSIRHIDRCSRTGDIGRGSKKAILLRVLRPAAASSAYLWSSARCLAAPSTSCLRASWKRGFHGLRTYRIGPIACIVTSTDWYFSSGTNLDIADRLLFLVVGAPELRRFRALCQKMVAIRFHQTCDLTPVHRCERFAPV